MSQKVNFRTDQDLLAIARNVLSKAGYTHKEIALESQIVLLAENRTPSSHSLQYQPWLISSPRSLS